MDVLNGSGDINYTRTVASRIGALAYRIDRVTRADRFDYPRDRGLLPHRRRAARRDGSPGSSASACARSPAADGPNSLVVVVGPARL